jgi:PAS domain S-box-containing protein
MSDPKPDSSAWEGDLFRLLVENTQDYAVFAVGLDGEILTWNPGAERVLGYAEDEIVGRPTAVTFTPEDRATGVPERELRTALAEGRAGDDRWHARKDARRIWVNGVLTLLRDAEGRPRGFAKVMRDFTEGKLAQEALRESQERLHVALSAGQMGTWLWRIPTDEQILDDSLRRLMGLPPGDEVRTLDGFLRAVHPDDRARTKAEFERCLREGGDFAVEFRVTWPDGSVHWLKDQGRVFPGPDGAPLFMAGAAMDITDRRAAEDALREADRRKDEFLAMLGHELRNPLAPLRGVVETFRRQKLEGDVAVRAFAMMDRQVSHLTRLLDDLLDVSRITRGLVELRKEPVGLAEVVEQAVEMAAPAIDGRGHELTLALPRKPLRVEGDATRLMQVVFNLLNNAAKYTDPNGRIWLTVEREGDRAVVRVRDDGSGIPPDLLPKVFDVFTQGQRSLDRAQGGLGLGLTLVRRLVEMHGGTVEARSEGPGKGSEFTVRLPALPAEAAASAGAARQPAPPREPPQVPRALVVDDNSDVAESMTWMLEGLAREIRTAHSGPQALELAPEFGPDVILCDIGMPGMDGYETARRLRQLPGLEKAVIAAVSGYGGEEDRRRSREAGFDLHLVKPVARAALVDLVRAAAGGG